jgi:hypothetical protein
MMDVKPFAESAEVNEEVVKELVEKHGSLCVIRAICSILKADMEKRIENREKWLNNACKEISEKKQFPSSTE